VSVTSPQQKLTRLSINMNTETTEQLRQFAAAKHLTYTEAVRRAIAIAVFIEAEHEAGRRIQTVDEVRNEVRELVLT
jgi:hypothetical protein